ncbi:hypothetical protein Y1Q_0013732 [Alligator mississippiensis]|uniref:Uncharacterized protein n=1 Tax=Alligator mississippiensis TaxID=8496 RepID=A0A151NVV2_ALLMI|nr:hypothetical protein Y1Q_0013732 [Alligator mississippiensis]
MSSTRLQEKAQEWSTVSRPHLNRSCTTIGGGYPGTCDTQSDEIDLMKKVGIIKESWNCWRSPAVVVPKTNGSIRLCISYRKVNEIAVFDTFLMPQVNDMLEKISQVKHRAQKKSGNVDFLSHTEDTPDANGRVTDTTSPVISLSQA